MAPLSLYLAAGTNALAFGSGLFGSPVGNSGGMGALNADIAGVADYFFWDGTQWKEDGFSGARFLVIGEPIQEPDVLSLVALPLLVMIRGTRRRGGRKAAAP